MSKKTVHFIVDYLESSDIDTLPPTKEDLIVSIQNNVDDNEISMVDTGKLWSKKKLIKEVRQLDDNSFHQFKCEFGAILKKRERDLKSANYILDTLKEAYPEEEIYLNEFVSFDKNMFGVEIYMCGQNFTFEYCGTVNDLVDNLKDEIDLHLADTVTCPYCRQNTMPRYQWHDRCFCDCGAEVFRDEDNHKVAKNAKFVDNDDNGHRMWFTTPDSMRILSGSIDERRDKFASYLIHRLKKYTDVDGEDNNYLEQQDTESILLSYRICSSCESEMYSQTDENTALMECTSFDSALMFMFVLGSSKHKH